MNTHDIDIELPPEFRSGNSVPVERATIKRERMEEILRYAIEADRKRSHSEAQEVCAEAYQVVGSLLSDLGIFETDEAEKILDNLSQARMVHKDVLPWHSHDRKRRGEPVACFKCGHAQHGGECVNVAPQPAEPSHINLLSEAKKFLDSYEDQGPYGEGWKSSELESLIEKIDAAIKAQSAEPSGSDPVAWLRSDQLRKLGRPYSDSPVNQRTDSMLLSAKGTPEAAAQYGHNVPVYAAPQPTEHSIDYKELYEQMCERCDHLDAKLAEYEHHSESVAWPRVNGISRDVHPRCLTLYLADTPTNDQMRAIHDTLRQAPQPAEPVKVLGDGDIETIAIGLGAKWDGSAWKIEDADLHPMIRTFLAHYGQPAQPASGHNAEPGDISSGHKDQPAASAEPVGILHVSMYRGLLESYSIDYTGSLPSGAYPVFTTPVAAQPNAKPHLYQHTDGRYGLSFGPAKFAKGEPAWYSVPIDVYEDDGR